MTAAQPINPPDLPAAVCPECGAAFWKTRADRKFCGDRCKRDHHRRREARGTELYDFAMAWRGKRLAGGFTELCRLLDGWLAEDRERKRRVKAASKGK